MFIERLLSSGPTPLLEQSIRFAADRQKLLTEDVANVDTPNYQQKDLSVERFQSMLLERVKNRDVQGNGSVPFDDVMGQMNSPVNNILFHDRNNRSMEQLMAESSKNALIHNTMIELLRKQISQLEMALKERVS